ncbi:L,D-transpeptidase [Cohnella faecalis]|uniref:L,D-transpeptidase n=1 Tax=Cohnella faecalis TaxID=2315694 RepID=A0A398CHN6_9BACL|nr:L,D-transpeptidase [Cohnella faecalis]RIE00629.1 L,D-transpeptidase [Cohnella faecalis]
MNKEKQIELQIQQFYDNVPNVDDDMPLKEYLLKHEDSRMAWYLLGKQYEAKGEDAKALYCFGQSGDIYEAFEGKPNPGIRAEAPKKDKGNRAGWIVAAGILLLLIGVGIPIMKEIMAQKQEEAKSAKPTIADSASGGLPEKTPEASLPLEASGGLGEKGTTPTAGGGSDPGLIAAAAYPDGDGQQALGQLLTHNPDASPLLLVSSPTLGRYYDWLKGGSPIASVTGSSQSKAAAVNWYDSKWCNCQPGEASGAQASIPAAWKPLQEEKLALVSALASYKQQYGKLPGSAAALNGDYPNNRIAGWSEEMSGWLKELTAEKPIDGKRDETVGVGWPVSFSSPESAAGQATPAGAWRPFTEQPLEIIVDKTRHRLAVVSGDVLIRNYEVGLGGKRTPEGPFVISEKVRNPNGRTDGAFGSRGMTLSDTRYGIHGTDEPDSIGKDESLGCIRMKKADLEELFDLVPLGTKVTISKGGLPVEVRIPEQRFRLPQEKNETNPNKVYDWLD